MKDQLVLGTLPAVRVASSRTRLGPNVPSDWSQVLASRFKIETRTLVTPESESILDGVDDIAYAYQSWEQAFGARGADHRPWHVPLRRLMWLWSTTWCAKWLALSSTAPGPDAGQNWSESNNENALNAHVRDRANHYLEPAVIDAIVSEFDKLDRLLA